MESSISRACLLSSLSFPSSYCILPAPASDIGCCHSQFAFPSPICRMLDVTMSMLGFSYLLIILIVASLVIALVLYEKRRRGLRIPNVPGPTGLPFVGNIFDVTTNAAEQYRKWSHQYSDVFQIQLGEIPVLVVNSASAAKAIFSGHSNALSSRPVFYTFHKVDITMQGHNCC